MNSEIFLYLKDISFEKIIISLCIFFLTMLIKWPIKKATANLTENKRKAVNTIIVFIPMLLSFVLNILYFGILKENWFGTKVFESAGSCYLFSVLIYAIYSRLVFIIKGIKPEKENDLSKECISYIKSNIKSISSSLKVDEENLEKIVLKIDELLKLREELVNKFPNENVKATESLDADIESLMSKKLVIEDSISKFKNKLLLFENSLKK